MSATSGCLLILLALQPLKGHCRSLVGFFHWLVCCLLAGLDLWKRMLLKCSITMIFTCSLLSLCTISSLFREYNNVVVLPFPFHIFMPLANLRFILHPKGKKLLLPLPAHPLLLFKKDAGSVLMLKEGNGTKEGNYWGIKIMLLLLFSMQLINRSNGRYLCSIDKLSSPSFSILSFLL